jgi:porin
MTRRIYFLFLMAVFLPGMAGGRQFLTGDWNDARQSAHDAGFDFFGSYATDLAANPVGGRSQGWTNPGSFDAVGLFDLEKIANIPGCSIYSSISWRNGSSLSSEYIDNEFSVQQLYGGQTFHLVELYLQESLFDQHLNIKLGRLCGGNDFLTSPIFTKYVTLAINANPVSIAYNAFFSLYPFATWGAYLDFQIRSLLFKFGVYNTNINIWKNKFHGANFTFESQQGVLLISEWAYQHGGGNDLKGNYRIGGYYITGRSTDNYGIYFLFDQMFYEHVWGTDRGIIGWGTFVYAPPDKNQFPYFFSFGLVDQGMFSSRPQDAICLGIAYGHYSSELNNPEIIHLRRKRFSSFRADSHGAETQIELNYWLQATPWFALTPVMQYVIHPKGLDSIPNALVVGLQVTIDL